MELFRSLLARLLKFRFVRFCITGGLNTAVDFLVFFLLRQFTGIRPYLGQVISYSTGILNSYCINRRWTFETKNRFFSREMLRFLAVNLAVLGVSVACMWLLTGRLDWSVWTAKLATTALTMVLGFVLNRLVVFRGAAH